MKKFIITTLFIILLLIGITSFFQLQLDRFFDKDIVNFTYTISSIMFSIVFSNISTYNYEIIKNYKLMNRLYNNIKKEKNSLLISFLINSFLVLFFYLTLSVEIINKVLIQFIPLISIGYSICYIMSLSSIFKSKKEIIDQIHEEEQILKSSHIK